MFDKVTIKLNPDYYKGKTFTIKTENNSASNIYIQSVQLDGKEINSGLIPFEKIVNGGELVIKLDENPVH